MVSIPPMDGCTTISHTKIQHPADTAIISALNGIDPDKIYPFTPKYLQRKEWCTCISPTRIVTTHHFKDQARLLSEIEATSIIEDRKFEINRLGNSSRALLITKQQINPADVSNQKPRPLLLKHQPTVVSDAKVGQLNNMNK